MATTTTMAMTTAMTMAMSRGIYLDQLTERDRVDQLSEYFLCRFVVPFRQDQVRTRFY